MNDEQLKKQIGANIVLYRKRKSLTQVGLANLLNYSDKAVSKWERGESMPDVLTLMQLAQVLGVTVDELLGNGTKEVKQMKPEEKPKADKNVISLLSSLLVWFVALLIYVVLASISIQKSWIAFIYAVPVNAVVLLSLYSSWRIFKLNIVYVSMITWGVICSLYISLLAFFNQNVWRIFLLGIPGQLAIALWFRIYKTNKKDVTNG